MKHKKQSSAENSKTMLIVITAMFSAVIAVATAFIKIPSPFGYNHAGDSMIYLAASILPAPYGIICASIGGVVADLISGYPQWAIATALIKALNAVPFIICKTALKNSRFKNRIINPPNLLMLIPTTIVTVFGYFAATGLMYSWEAAFAELTVWWVQPATGAIIFILAGAGLDAVKFKEKILSYL